MQPHKFPLIAEAMERKGLTAKEVKERADISDATWHSITRSKGDPRLSSCYKILSVIGLEPDLNKYFGRENQ